MIFRTTVFLLLLCAVGITQAQTPSDADLCKSIADNPDRAIKHCTAAIDSRKFSGAALAQLYTSRGAEWANKGETDRAIADFDASIKLKPDEAVVYHARAVELAVKGDYRRALEDFDTTLKLNPKAANAYFGRGRTRLYMGDYARAAADIETELKAHPNLYTAIWAYIARKRAGSNDAEVLLERETRRLREGWPTSVIVLYLGSTNVDSVSIAATTSDPVRQRELRCEADFYIAHWHLFNKEDQRAVTLLRQVQDACPRNILEYEGAVAELRRLK